MCVCVERERYTHIYIYIYIYRERERQRYTLYIYIYIYIYIYMYSSSAEIACSRKSHIWCRPISILSEHMATAHVTPMAFRGSLSGESQAETSIGADVSLGPDFRTWFSEDRSREPLGIPSRYSNPDMPVIPSRYSNPDIPSRYSNPDIPTQIFQFQFIVPLSE